MQAQYDVLGLGCVAVDDLLYVPSYPAADSKIKVVKRSRQYGGQTGMAVVAAARLGARCAYAGCLGADETSCDVEANFLREGVDVSHVPRPAGAAVVQALIVVGQDTASRTIFYHADGIIGAHPSLPDAHVIRGSRVLLIDQYGMPGNLRAAGIARDAGSAVVADFEDTADPLFPQVLALVDHLILAEEIARRITQQSDPGQAALALWRSQRAVVVVTCGTRGSWHVSDEGRGPELRHHPAFAVSALDTTGCGDVFHGAYAAALARGASPVDRIEFASAAAALKASGGHAPDRAAVERFLSAGSANPRHALEPLHP